MKNGIGPQSLGAAGMNPKSTPCGHPVSSPMKKLEDLSGDGKVTQKDVLIGRGVIDAEGNNPNNSGTPLYFQDDISKIQEAASTLEAHNIGSGGGEVQGAAAEAQKGMLMSSMQQGSQGGPGTATMRGLGGLFGRFARRR
tara:strand:+ start:574 stop:993 length:420 start_codon:yes stop_codon:yes gene_type:complete